MPGSSLTVAPMAGPSKARGTPRRNSKSVESAEDRCSPSTDENSIRVSSLKQKKRVKAELDSQSVIIPPPTTSVSFDVKSILPDTKSKKSLAKLRETSSLHKESHFECIDGELRTHSNNSNNPESPPPLPIEVLPSVENASEAKSSETTREQFKAFGIEAYPTKAFFNDICADFVRPSRWCILGSRCPRIHPLDKKSHLPSVVKEAIELARMKNTSKPDPSHIQEAAPILQTFPSHSHTRSASSSDAPIRVKLPLSSSSPSMIFAKAVGNLPPMASTRNSPLSRHRSTQSAPKIPSTRSSAELPDWDTLIRMQRPRLWHGDSSSESGDSDSSNDSDDELPRPAGPPYPDWDPRAWEATSDISAWSDSNATVEENVPSRSSASWYERNMEYHTSTPSLPPPPAHRPPKPQTVYSGTTFTRSGSERPQLPGADTKTVAIQPVGRKHPLPRFTERCRAWLHNRCQLGYDCSYVHDDLEYDDVLPEPAIPRAFDSQGAQGWSSTVERPMPMRNLEVYRTTIHDHIRVQFNAGFTIEDIATGFESPWVLVGGLPRNIADPKLCRLLSPFGEILEIVRIYEQHSTMPFKVKFSKTSEAYKAFSTLHGTIPFGHQKLELRMAIERKMHGPRIKDNVVRIDWEYPHRCVYMGYATQEMAQEAVKKAQTIPYEGFMTSAQLFNGIPAVGKVTVKFHGLPPDVTQEGMTIYGTHQGMVTERPTYPDFSPEDTIHGIKRYMKRYQSTMTELEFRPPPYKGGKMRAWAYFNTAKDAQSAADECHGRRPTFLGPNNRLSVRHIKTITFPLQVFKFRQVQAEIRVLQEKIWRHCPGHALTFVDMISSYLLRLTGEDLQTLSRLKAEIERILRGELLLDNGKVAWDDFFGRHYGILFLQGLGRQYSVEIEKDISRRTIRLFGSSENRTIAREKILEKISELQLQQFRNVPLDGRMIAAFLHGEYNKLQEKVGSDNVRLDLWQRCIRVRGDEDAQNVAFDVIDQVRKQTQDNPMHQVADDECPVCFSEASSPVKLACGHSFCRTCLQRYLKAAVDNKLFPVTCLGNEARCQELIPLTLAKALISAGDFHAIVDAAFDTHIQSRPDEFHYCPTPDCPQIYRSVSKEGVFIQCPSCLVRICPSCHTDAHDGLTCAESGEGDELFRDWAGQHDVKQCPKCKMAIEKDEGCNHMVCVMCKTHICWVCMETFPNGDGIYGHMRILHGSFGLGPIDQ